MSDIWCGDSGHTKRCKKCEKIYKQYVEDQVPGCRSKDFDICPYCGNINGSSFDEEYDNYPIEEETSNESTTYQTP